MTTLFDSTTIVKPSTFGRGVLASHPDDTMPYTAADLAWAAQEFGETTEGGECESDYDELAAAEAAALDALELGLLPRDLAELIASTTLVGHPG
jgi:hypothetical protein